MEELLTSCLGRFYALDIFLDDMIAYQFRERGGRKMTIQEALDHFMERVDFILNAGRDYQPEESAYFGRVFLQAQVNPYTKIRTSKIGFHNVIDLARFLKVMGDQKFQITLSLNGEPFAHYVMKIDGKKVHYLDITDKYQKDATVNIELDINDLQMVSDKQMGRFATKMLATILRKSKFSSLIKSIYAFLTTFMTQKATYGLRKSKNGDKIKLPKGFMDDFAAADGWDPEAYREIKRRNASP